MPARDLIGLESDLLFVAGWGEAVPIGHDRKDFAHRDVLLLSPSRAPERITKGPLLEQYAVWTEDGQGLAVVGTERPNSVAVTRQVLALFTASGERQRDVVRCAPPRCSSLGAVAWHPLGHLALNHEGAIRLFNESGHEIDVLLEQGRLTATGRMSWSPDGQQLLFSAYGKSGAVNLFVVNSSGGRPRPLTRCSRPECSSSSPTWSPTGKEIAFVRGVPAGSLYIIDASGGDSQPLLRCDAPTCETGVGAPDWSPSGGNIAVDIEGDIHVVSIEDGSAHQLTEGPRADCCPQWRPITDA